MQPLNTYPKFVKFVYLSIALSLPMLGMAAVPIPTITYVPAAAKPAEKVSISSDGRYIAYRLNATKSDIFVYDRVGDTLEQANLTLTGDLPATSRCNVPVISGDGRYVVFACDVANMGLTGNGQGYFRYDRINKITETVMTATTGLIDVSLDAGITYDGRYIAYRIANGSTGYKMYIRDMVAKTTEAPPAASTAIGGIPAAMFISRDDRYISYLGRELVTTPYTDMSVYDRTTGLTERVGLTVDGKRDTSSNKWDLSMSADGNIFTYRIGTQIYVRDRKAGTIQIISGAGGAGNMPSLSGNGRYIAYSGRVAPETSDSLYIYDRLTKVLRKTPFKGRYSRFSNDGRYLAVETSNPASTIGIVDFGLAAGLTLSSSSLSLTEGGAEGTYTVALTQAPSANVIVTLKPDAQLSLARTQLTFTPQNWNVPQIVSAQAIQDGVAQGAHTATIINTVTSSDIEYTVISPATVIVAIADAIIPTLILPGTNWDQTELAVTGTAAPGATVILTATNRNTGWLTSVSAVADGWCPQKWCMRSDSQGAGSPVS